MTRGNAIVVPTSVCWGSHAVSVCRRSWRRYITPFLSRTWGSDVARIGGSWGPPASDFLTLKHGQGHAVHRSWAAKRPREARVAWLDYRLFAASRSLTAGQESATHAVFSRFPASHYIEPSEEGRAVDENDKVPKWA